MGPRFVLRKSVGKLAAGSGVSKKFVGAVIERPSALLKINYAVDTPNIRGFFGA
jgi:hypothetical protein